jgi:hypothetical protein
MMVCGFHQSLEDEDEWNEKHFLVFGELNHTTTISEIVKSQRMKLLLRSFGLQCRDGHHRDTLSARLNTSSRAALVLAYTTYLDAVLCIESTSVLPGGSTYGYGIIPSW